MNPLASPKCARRLLTALATISGIFFTVACGSGNPITPPNNQGFSNSNFTGTYVLSVSGTDVNLNANTESFFAIVGTITADGMGNITGGTVDINDPNIGGVFTGQMVSKSTYNVSTDGRGTGSLVTPQGTFALDFVLTSNNHGMIIRFDGDGTGSGTLDTQGSATQSSLQSLAFSLSGADVNQSPLGTVGGFTLNSSGTITPGSGVQDVNDSGTSAGFTNLPLTGSVVLTSSTAGTAEFDTDFGSLLFDVWVIDSNHLKIIETDDSGLALSGDAFTQQTSFPSGQLVFTFAGIDHAAVPDPVAAGGYVTTDVNGNLINGIEDYNNAGSPNTVPNFTATCNASAPFAKGRCQLSTTGFSNGLVSNLEFAAYPSSAGILLLQDDSQGLLQGTANAQTATAFTAPLGYALNLSGVNTDGQGDVGEVDDIAQFNATTAAAPATNMTGVLDENAILNVPVFDSSLSGTYTPDSPATGRGSISVNTPKTFIGGLSLEYYVVNGSTALFIEGDNLQVSAGIFEAQSTPGGNAQHASLAAAQSPIAITRPVFRRHAAWQPKADSTGFRK
jgi:hypothetical protein